MTLLAFKPKSFGHTLKAPRAKYIGDLYCLFKTNNDVILPPLKEGTVQSYVACWLLNIANATSTLKVKEKNIKSQKNKKITAARLDNRLQYFL